MVFRLIKQCCIAIVLCTIVLICLSCSTGSDRSSVEGEVTFEGEPVDKGSIVFIPEGGGIKTGGQINEGRYQIPSEKGPPPGRHKVIMFWEKKTGKTYVDSDTGDVYDQRSEGLPSQYQSEKSPLEVEIVRGKNVHDFHLTGAQTP